MRDDSNFQINHDIFHTLHFHQVNVGRGGQNLDIALQQAWEARAHVVMVQEPWTMRKCGYFTTKSHPGYKSHIPISPTESRPRAITFTMKGIHATQMYTNGPGQTVDYCFVQVSGITIVNVYRAPGPSGTLQPLIQWEPSGPTIIGGDFNAVSRLWQPQASRQYGDGDKIIEWTMKNDIHLINIAGEATHRDGNVIDLVWSNTYATAVVSKDYNCTSDHMTITGSIQAKKCANFREV